PHPFTPTLLPYPTLFRSFVRAWHHIPNALDVAPPGLHQPSQIGACLRTTRSSSRHEEAIVTIERSIKALYDAVWRPALIKSTPLDRKSTRLNSSHVAISY